MQMGQCDVSGGTVISLTLSLCLYPDLLFSSDVFSFALSHCLFLRFPENLTFPEKLQEEAKALKEEKGKKEVSQVVCDHHHPRKWTW